MSAFDTFQLGLAVLSQLPADDNVVLSPMSLATVMALLFCGARNATRSELASVLHLSDGAVDRLAAAVGKVLASGSGDLARLRCSTAIYAAADYPVDPSYAKDVASRLFSSSVTNMDFTGHPEAARQQINEWVAKETADLIRDLLPPGSVSSLTVAVVANALHFKGLWLEPFDARRTRVGKFRVSKGLEVDAHMMHLSSRFPCGFSEEHQLQLLRLPYSGVDANLSMLLMLPMEGMPLDAALGRLAGGDGSGLASLVASMSPMKADVLLPRFSVSATVDVKKVLIAMGVDILFSDKADLTAMCPRGGVHVSSFVHRAVIEVNEEGTEAAAATAAVINKRSMPIIQRFFCDRPFAFAVWHEPTASAIFLGKVLDPTASVDAAGGQKPSAEREEL